MSPLDQGSNSRFLELPVEIRMMIYPYLFRVPENQGILITNMCKALYTTLGKHKRTTFISPAHLVNPGTYSPLTTVPLYDFQCRVSSPLVYCEPTIMTTYTYCRTYYWECTFCSDLRGRATCSPDPYVHRQDGSYTTSNPNCSCPLQQPRLCTAILSTCRQICAEATPCLYGQHTFDFGQRYEAAAAFFKDRSPYSISALRTIAVKVPVARFVYRPSAWQEFCGILAKCGRVEKLELTLKIEHQAGSMDGCQPLKESDVKELFELGHPMLSWVVELSGVRGIKELTVLPLLPGQPSHRASLHQTHESWTSGRIRRMSIPESVEEGLAKFLRKQLGMGITSELGDTQIAWGSLPRNLVFPETTSQHS